MKSYSNELTQSSEHIELKTMVNNLVSTLEIMNNRLNDLEKQQKYTWFWSLLGATLGSIFVTLFTLLVLIK